MSASSTAPPGEDRARPLPGPLRLLGRYLAWLCYAVLLTWPTVLSMDQVLIGHPKVDVWNHAWGYWWVPSELAAGELPWFTTHLVAPDGGVLYYIDMLGALLATPMAWVLGPAITYNYVLMARVAMAGLSAQLLAEELASRQISSTAVRWGGVLAGLAYATSPYLLSELSNSISEVCNVHWVSLTTLAAVRAFRGGGVGRWVVLGVLQGLTTASTFYYGLLTAVMVFLLYLARCLQDALELPQLLRRGLIAAVTAVVVAVPFIQTFRASLDHGQAIIHRPRMLRSVLLKHNAVDPWDFITPGDFQSVVIEGEYFLHTAYLRWTVLALVALALWRQRRHWGWIGLAALSLVLSLGDYLFTGGEFVRTPAGEPILLPFGYLTMLIEALAITHPLRFSVFAQLVFSTLAGVGLAELLQRLRRGGTVVALVAMAAVWAESTLGSSASWPLPLSNARVPAVYDTFADGILLDLPAEAGNSMLTSQYLWFQTHHQHPLPYRVDVRANRARDPTTFNAFTTRDGEEAPGRPIDYATALHIRQRYSAIIVHHDIERITNRPSYYHSFYQWFGEPEQHGDLLVWRMR